MRKGHKTKVVKNKKQTENQNETDYFSFTSYAHNCYYVL
jgi:hypothetical protein